MNYIQQRQDEVGISRFGIVSITICLFVALSAATSVQAAVTQEELSNAFLKFKKSEAWENEGDNDDEKNTLRFVTDVLPNLPFDQAFLITLEPYYEKVSDRRSKYGRQVREDVTAFPPRRTPHADFPHEALQLEAYS